MRKHLTTTIFMCLSLQSTTLMAELFDRGGGLIYDDVLDVTWLQDANYAKTTGHIESLYIYDQGIMYWDDAQEWVENLEYYDTVRNVVWDDWRLPRILPINNESYQDIFSYNGTTDWGYNNISTNSELAYMNYINLGDIAGYDINGYWSPEYQDIENSGPFINLTKQYVWSQNPGTDSGSYRVFTFGLGSQSKSGTYYNRRGVAWAVRDGDVTTPTPKELIENLTNDVLALNLQRGISNALDHKLETIQRALEDSNSNNDASIFNLIYTFIYSVEAQRGKHILDEQADALIAAAYAIIDSLDS